MGVRRDGDHPREMRSFRTDGLTEHRQNHRARTIVKIGLSVLVLAMVMLTVGLFIPQLRYIAFIGIAPGGIGAALVFIGMLKAAFNDGEPTEDGQWTGGAWRH